MHLYLIVGDSHPVRLKTVLKTAELAQIIVLLRANLLLFTRNVERGIIVSTKYLNAEGLYFTHEKTA